MGKTVRGAVRAKRYGGGTGKTVRGGSTGKTVQGAVRAKRYGGSTGKTVRGRYGQNGRGAVGAGKG